jgi:transcriptional regulator with GAF, ATPase, and Fis domain
VKCLTVPAESSARAGSPNSAPQRRECPSIVERGAIVRALQKMRYNKTAAAKLPGMSFRALQAWDQKLGIEQARAANHARYLNGPLRLGLIPTG